ncbi:MAG: hypothetical protein PHQ98_03715 [Candidatus ainarchaeum sp.]|nr:hypothetical protein [Candidatus ainarchaeum sp.]
MTSFKINEDYIFNQLKEKRENQEFKNYLKLFTINCNLTKEFNEIEKELLIDLIINGEESFFKKCDEKLEKQTNHKFHPSIPKIIHTNLKLKENQEFLKLIEGKNYGYKKDV